MTTPPSFPTLRGRSWSVHKKPIFSTRVASHVSGREVRAPLYAYPLYEFELIHNALASGSAVGAVEANSLQTLMGFYLQMQGQYGTFLYTDPTDSSVTGQVIATGDGATSVFTLVRGLGAGPAVPVGWALSVTSVTINGGQQQANDIFPVADIFAEADIFNVQTPSFSLVPPNKIALSGAPVVGAVIAATFTYAFICRFDDDQEDFEQFMSGLWKVGSLKFRSTKA